MPVITTPSYVSRSAKTIATKQQMHLPTSGGGFGSVVVVEVAHWWLSGGGGGGGLMAAQWLWWLSGGGISNGVVCGADGGVCGGGEQKQGWCFQGHNGNGMCPSPKYLHPCL